MAISKIMTIKKSGSKEKKGGAHLKNAIEYICNPEKTEGGLNIFSVNCLSNPQSAFLKFTDTRVRLNNNGNRAAYHMVLSCPPEETSPDIMMKITQEFVNEFLENKYEAISAIHNNTEKMHSHIIFNAVSYIDGKKYRYEKGDWIKIIQPILNSLCKKYGLSELNIEEKKDTKKIPNEREKMKNDIDAGIKKSQTFEEFLYQMKEKKYKCKYGKYLAFKSETGERYIRTKSIGENYSEYAIKLRINLNSGTMKNYKLNYVLKNKKIVSAHIKNKSQWTKYKKRKMSAYQKWVLKKAIRTKQVLGYNYMNNNWKQKDNVKSLRQALEEYHYVVEKNIHGINDLQEKKEDMLKKRKELIAARADLKRDKKIYGDVIEKYKKLQELKTGYIIFAREKNPVFEDEYKEYISVQKEIESMGLKISEIKRYMDNAGEKADEYKKVNREYTREENIIDRLIKKYSYDSIYSIENKKENYADITFSYDDFSGWAESRIANSYTFERVFNHNTENDYSRDNIYIICDRLNPLNYIKVISTREEYAGEEYTKSSYEIFKNNEKIAEKNDGRFKNRPKDYWYKLKQEMRELSGFGDDNIIFEDEDNHRRYMEAYKKYRERTDRNDRKQDRAFINKNDVRG